MIDLSNQTHLPRTNPTQIISLHSVHELFMKYLYFQTRKKFFELKAYFSNLKEFILLVRSVTFCLFPAGFFHYPDFGFSPDFSTVRKIYSASTLESLIKAEHESLFWHCLYTVLFFVYS